MRGAAVCRLFVVVLLGLSICGGAAADRGWYDERRYDGGRYDHRGAAPGCCDPGWGAYQPYPHRPYYPPAVIAPPQAPRGAWRPPPPVVVVPMQPPVTYGRPAAEFVYWCDHPKGYYPNVTNCNGPWREQSATMPR